MLEVLTLLLAPAEIPTVVDLLEEKEDELQEQIEQHTEEVQEELAQRIQADIDHRKWHEEQDKQREEEERKANEARAEAAREAEARQATANEQELSPGKWEPIARCESGYGGPPQWDLNTGNGFFGGLQFELSSWQWVGGTGYPHEASKQEQIKRAEILLERQGWKAWPVCSRKVGYR